MLKKKAELLVIDESMDNELRDNKNILTNLSNHENQNQVILLKFYFLCNVVKVKIEQCTYNQNTFQK